MSEAPPTKKARTEETGWSVNASQKAENTTNPIRVIVDKIVATKRDVPGKPMIPFMLGDPTAFGNLHVPDVFNDALCNAIKSRKANGYGNSTGLEPCRTAIAKYHTKIAGAEHVAYKASDVYVASGCSGALEIAINGIVNPGDNLLVPNPAFPLYQVLAESHGASVKEYRLDPGNQWAVDVASLEAAIDENTKAILVNNPSNPCGSVLPEDNLRAIVAVAKKHKLPIIADEIYGSMTYEGETFFPVASLTDEVPVITASGVAKQFLVPGWRVGWLLVHDPLGVAQSLRDGYQRLTTLIVGANTIVQAAIPEVLDPAEGSREAADLAASHAHYMGTLESNAKFTVEKLKECPGIEVIVPQGAMYVMVRVKVDEFKDIPDDAEFTRLLLAEENVFVLPGSCFGMRNFVRLVISGPQAKLSSGYARIIEFCANHLK
jgi:tyrosine aminotransferase